MSAIAVDRTVALLRFLRTHPVQHHARVPAPVSLEPLQREYWSALTPFACDRARRAFAEVESELLADLLSQGRRRGIFDQRKTVKPLDDRHGVALVKQARARFEHSWPPPELPPVVQQFARRTDQHQRIQLDRQVQVVLNVDYASLERPVHDLVSDWVTRNVRLIGSVPLGHASKPGYFDRLASSVEEAYRVGTPPEALARTLEEDHEIARRDALRIARTEISRLNGAVAKHRQTALGVAGYTWRCVRDNRVRDCHADLDDTPQRWDSPPMGGGTDETEPGHPGDGINCRCYAEPDFSGLLGR